ncbi:MAG: phosphotransferase, partial [Planctomycetota bacterium]
MTADTALRLARYFGISPDRPRAGRDAGSRDVRGSRPWWAGRNLVAWSAASAEGPHAITHGDYRVDNMLFATAEGGYPLAVVDWQTCGHGTPVADASYFLGASVLPELRR